MWARHTERRAERASLVKLGSCALAAHYRHGVSGLLHPHLSGNMLFHAVKEGMRANVDHDAAADGAGLADMQRELLQALPVDDSS